MAPVIHRQDLATLPRLLREAGAERVLLIVGQTRRHLDRLKVLLSEFALEIFAGARRHVPEASVAQANRALVLHRADTVVSVGGGSATGLAKALRLSNTFRFVAIPTTYSGSELTNIYGMSSQGTKQTGRDDRVRPDIVLYDVELTGGMSKGLTLTSLMNALAHPLSALGTQPSDETRERALEAIATVYGAVEGLVQAPENQRARLQALVGAGLAAQVLDGAQLGMHHQLAHRLGGRFDLDHAALHSVLLPYSVAELRRHAPEALRRVDERLQVPNFEASLFDFLTRTGLATSLKALGVELSELEALAAEHPDLPRSLLRSAFLGRRPSRNVRLEDWGLREPVSVRGPELERARRVVIAIHGRSATADAILRHTEELIGSDPEVCIVAPQAPNNLWYGARYNDSRERIGPELTLARAESSAVLQRVLERSLGAPVLLFGFSQGACLALDLFAEFSDGLSGIAALSGACIGLPEEWPVPRRPNPGTPVLLGASREDPWVSREDIERTAKHFSEAGCSVKLALISGSQHRLHVQHRVLARELLLGKPQETLPGYRNFHESESLPGALPVDRNSPRRAPYGLFPEQLNGTSFTAPRTENLRSWSYRIRPSAQHGKLLPLPHETFSSSFAGEAPDPNLSGFSPLALPDSETDFVDGLCTVGGAGSPHLRRGFAIHVYAANRDMEDRAFCDADGDLLILPELGALTLLTEFGVLQVSPGSLALIPRGVRFSVLLREGIARGYVAETFGRHFELAERGPVGANGLGDARHFRAPAAWHEDRLAPGYRLTEKFGGALYQATQDYSPYDVVAWHGNYAPTVYDLSLFSPVSNSRFDHADPSIYTLLSAPLDEVGSNSLDLVIFPARWDVSENTFRPPYFHRNLSTEFNGILKQPAHGDSPFVPGCYFISPSLTPHGVLAESVERALFPPDDKADRPSRLPEDSLWFQFETALPLSLSPWARHAPNRIADWHAIWGAYRCHFDTR